MKNIRETPVSKMGGAGGLTHVHPVMRGEGDRIEVRHPALPGMHMMAPGADYAELPPGANSKHNAPGGIIGGLAPFQTAQGAQMGEFQNG